MRIYLDSNVFISAIEGERPSADAVRELLAVADNRAGMFVTSELSLAEVLVAPFALMSGKLESVTRSTPVALATDYTDTIAARPGMIVAPITREALILAARIRADDKRIKLPDAIHVATAAGTECTHFVTGDKDLLVRVKRFEMVDLESSSLNSLVAAARERGNG